MSTRAGYALECSSNTLMTAVANRICDDFDEMLESFTQADVEIVLSPPFFVDWFAAFSDKWSSELCLLLQVLHLLLLEQLIDVCPVLKQLMHKLACFTAIKRS